MRITADLKGIFPGQNGFERAASCYERGLFSGLKIFHIQNISAIFPSHPIIPICGKLVAMGFGANPDS
jgi:hypothetical protein